MKWYDASSKSGDVGEERVIGVLYPEWIGVSKDEAEALKQGGNRATAQATPVHVPKDGNKALKWLRKAADYAFAIVAISAVVGSIFAARSLLKRVSVPPSVTATKTPRQQHTGHGALAALPARLAARFLDFCLLGIPALLLFASFGRNITGYGAKPEVLVVSLTLTYVLYFSVSSFNGSLGTTFGKKVFGLRLIRTNGKPVTLAWSLLRSAIDLVGMVPIGLGFLPILFDKKRRSLADWVCKTHVVPARDCSAFPQPATTHTTELSPWLLAIDPRNYSPEDLAQQEGIRPKLNIIDPRRVPKDETTLATLPVRFCARFLDLALLAILLTPLVLNTNDQFGLNVIFYSFLCYFSLCKIGGHFSTTVGKARLGLRITRVNGQPLTIWWSLLRAAVDLNGTLLFGLGFLPILFDEPETLFGRLGLQNPRCDCAETRRQSKTIQL